MLFRANPLFVLRLIQDTSRHSVGRMCNFCMLNLVVHKVTARLLKVNGAVSCEDHSTVRMG
jgi:hypothetical protein